MLSKKDKFIQAFDHQQALCCPICRQAVHREGDALRCAAGHTQNINRKGCLNILSKQTEGCYDAALFAARRTVFASGCYQAVANAIREEIPSSACVLLDAGCGEGWWLNTLLADRSEYTGIGIDISRDAILQATDQPCSALWIVGDVRKLPVADQSIDVLLDVLTPASYAEFARVLKPDGRMIKVYPGEHYLQEIRTARGLPNYTDGQVDQYLDTHARIIQRNRVTIQHPVSPELWAAFVQMTPLTQDLTPEEKQQLASRPSDCITIDLWVTTAKLN